MMEIWTRDRQHVIDIVGNENPTELASKLEAIFSLKSSGHSLFFRGVDDIIGKAERIEINLILMGFPVVPEQIKANKRWKLF